MARIVLNYKLERVLGSGGMGTVYLARHTRIGRTVAIKELKPEYARQPAIRERFKNEAALMANLSHPNIVNLHDYVETPQGVFLILEYVEGITLDAYLRRVSGPIPEEKAIQAFVKILEAVAYAHQQGIVHRDLKPANIMINQEGAIKILDFGIAKQIDQEARFRTRTGVRMGTIYYMSPEQLKGRGVDARSDIYSLGITLFEMLTGQNPFSPDLSEYDLIMKIANEPLPNAQSLYPNISTQMQKVLEKATAKNPDERFQTAQAFAKALQGEAFEEIQANIQRSNTMEWVIDKEQEAKKVAGRTVLTSSRENSPRVKEYLVLDSPFGIITNRKISYYQGRDLFEKGELKEIYLRKVISVSLDAKRDWFTAISSVLLALILMIWLWAWWAFLLALPLIGLGGLGFLEFPAIVIVRSDFKKIRMKAWPWQKRLASEYVYTAKEQLDA